MPDSFNRNGTIVSNQKEIANNLNEYFVNVGPRLAKKISEQSPNYKAYLINSDNNSTFLDPITEKEVEVEISQLKENRATGYDDLAPKLVKNISKYTVQPLTYIFNQTFLTGVLPKELKIALVTPVFKANERDQFKNYSSVF